MVTGLGDGKLRIQMLKSAFKNLLCVTSCLCGVVGRCTYTVWLMAEIAAYFTFIQCILS